MKRLDEILAGCAADPTAPMVEVLDGRELGRRYNRGQMHHAIAAIAAWLDALQSALDRPAKVGLVMHNSPEWVAADLALLHTGAIEVPVPLAFSTEQALHLLSGADLCLVDARGAERLQGWLAAQAGEHPPIRVVDIDRLLATAPVELAAATHDPQRICKIIHTSGTTSRPKGVMIRAAGVDDLIASLRNRIEAGTYARYLSLVPLSLLIEQVVAIYMTLRDGGTLSFLPPEVPLLGDTGATSRSILDHLPAAAPTALTLPPSMVEALLAACRAMPGESVTTRSRRLFGRETPTFLACGGAPTAPAVISELAEFGLPVFEGYGLSENSSVVAWNSPHCYKPGTVGRPLDHVQVRLAADGELLIKSSSLFAGYASADPSSCELDADGWLHTGDVATLDDDGFLRVFGRKKNLIITANGRNVSPEWVESRYKSLDSVEHAVIFGDGLEALHGFFVIAPGVAANDAEAQIRRFGERHLSEIERVELVFTVASNADLYQRYFTVTGRPQREAIWQEIQDRKNEHKEQTWLAH